MLPPNGSNGGSSDNYSIGMGGDEAEMPAGWEQLAGPLGQLCYWRVHDHFTTWAHPAWGMRVVEGHLVRMQAPSHFTLETRAHTRTNLHTHTHTRTFSLCMFVTHACDSPTASVFFIIYFWDGIFSEEFGRKNFFLARVRFLYRICLARAFFYSIRVRDRVRLYSSHCKK